MENAATKLKGSFVTAPMGAVTGAFLGYLLSRELGYNKSITVISFTIVGLIVGSTIGQNVKE